MFTILLLAQNLNSIKGFLIWCLRFFMPFNGSFSFYSLPKFLGCNLRSKLSITKKGKESGLWHFFADNMTDQTHDRLLIKLHW